MKKSFPKNYPANPQTIGKHILKKRLELRLLQKDVAVKIGVSEDTITLWENEKANPQIHLFPKIFAFLGKIPFDISAATFGEQIKHFRVINGLSQAYFGSMVGVHATTVAAWERGEGGKPKKIKIDALKMILKTVNILV